MSTLRRGILSAEIKKNKILNTITLYVPEYGTELDGPNGLCFDYPVASNITINGVCDGEIKSVFNIPKGSSCVENFILYYFNSNGASCGLYCEPSEDNIYRYEVKIEESTSFQVGEPVYLNTELEFEGGGYYRNRCADSISEGLCDWIRSFNKLSLTSEIEGMIYIDSFPVTRVVVPEFTQDDIILYTDNIYNGSDGMYYMNSTISDIVTNILNI